jgi:uncharacterized protein (TIGR02001 family)
MKGSLAKAVVLTLLTGVSAGVSAADEEKKPAEEKKPDPPYALTGNFGLFSEYRYRGISQTNSHPAVQGGLDYTHKSGGYVGIWASNVSWLSDGGGGKVSSSIEIDIYGGYKFRFDPIDYDVGLLQYWYPGSYPAGFVSPNTTEIYGSATWKQYTVKLSYALTDLFGYRDSQGATYLEGAGKFDLGDGYTLGAHLGYQRIPGSGSRTTSDCSYADLKVGVTKEFFGITLGADAIGTNAKGGTNECFRNAFNHDTGRATLVVSATKTF